MSILQTVAYNTAAVGLSGLQIAGAIAVDTGRIYLEPLDRADRYNAESLYTNLQPSPEMLARLYWAGGISNDRFEDQLSKHGIDWNGDFNDPQKDRWLWNRIFAVQRPIPGIAEHLTWFRQGRLNRTTLLNSIRRTGVDDGVYGPLIADSFENLDSSTIWQLWQRGLVDDKELYRRMAVIGFTVPGDVDLMKGISEGPRLGELILLLNRGLIDDSAFYQYLRWLGFRGTAEQQLLYQLRYDIPGPSDLTRYAIRHAFEPSIAIQYEYDQEMPPSYIEWHAKQGLGQVVPIVDPYDGQTYNVSWAQMNWWSHWVWPAPTSAYTMLHRLRATGGANGGPRSTSGLVFSPTDLGRLLRGNDYPPYWRPYLAAISYRTLQRGDTDQLLRQGNIDQLEASEQFQDQGYTQGDAQLLVQKVTSEVQWEQIKALRSRQMMKVNSAYIAGVLDKDTATVQIWMLTLPTLAQVNWANGLSPADQLSNASGDKYVAAMVAAADAQAAVKLVNATISAIKASYMRLEIGNATALQLLTAAGIASPRAQQYLSLWGLLLQVRGRELSASQVVKFYREGLVSATDANTRLGRLGYDSGGIALILADADLAIQATSAKQQAQQAKTLAAKQKAQQQLIKAQQAAAKAAQAALAKHGSPAQLAKWLKRGLIGQTDFVARLTALGWPQDDINRLYDDALNPGTKPITGQPVVPAPAPPF